MGAGLPVALSTPLMAAPKGPDWKAVLSSSTTVAHEYPCAVELIIAKKNKQNLQITHLVASQSVSGASHGAERALALDHVHEDLGRVRALLALRVDHHALGRVHAQALVLLDLASLVDAGGAVDDEGEVLVRGDAEAQRVGAQARLHAESGRNEQCVGFQYRNPREQWRTGKLLFGRHRRSACV